MVALLPTAALLCTLCMVDAAAATRLVPHTAGADAAACAVAMVPGLERLLPPAGAAERLHAAAIGPVDLSCRDRGATLHFNAFCAAAHVAADDGTVETLPAPRRELAGDDVASLLRLCREPAAAQALRIGRCLQHAAGTVIPSTDALFSAAATPRCAVRGDARGIIAASNRMMLVYGAGASRMCFTGTQTATITPTPTPMPSVVASASASQAATTTSSARLCHVVAVARAQYRGCRL
jgi:hypothetical protein